MTTKEINSDGEDLARIVMKVSGPDLSKMGLRIDSFIASNVSTPATGWPLYELPHI